MSKPVRPFFTRFAGLLRGRLMSSCLVVAACLHCVGSVAASNSTQQLQSAVHRLNARLGTGDDAEGWRRYLLLNVLETQSAKGEQADLATLEVLLQRFSSNAEGLDHPVFADVRTALGQQIQSLNRAQSLGIENAMAAAPMNFQPITIAMMEAYRDAAIGELETLKIFYRAEFSSHKRSDAFYTLELDDTINFLNEVEIELAPQISVGKINSMIRDVNQRLETVIEKIDALPFRADNGPQPDNGNNDSRLDGPQPDEDSGLADLKSDRKSLETRIEELKKQSREIAQNDAPRVRTRGTNLRRLFQLESSFAVAAEDFGDPYFVSARLAFERFVRAYYYGTEDNLQEDFLLRIERLKDELPKLNNVNDRAAAGIVGSSLDWLENTFQAPDLVTSIRARYSLPNAYVAISGNLLNQLGSQSLTQSRPIYEVIKGRLVRGTASNTGNVSFDLIDDPNQVHLSIRATTDVTSNTYLQQQKIKVYVDAAGQAEARRSIFLNVGGLLESDPYAAANINTFFQGTSSSCNLVNRIAQQQFAEKEQESNVGASSQVRTELMERFLAETNAPIEQGKAAFAKAQSKSRDRSNFIPELYVHTQANRIMLVGKKSSKSTLAAPNLPAQSAMLNDVEVRLHDSLLTNYVDPIFSGKTFTNEQLAEELKKLTGSEDTNLGANPAAGANDEPFSITFATIRPIQLVFAENTLAIEVSAKSFAQGNRRIDQGLVIRVKFRITREEGELRLVRDGKAELDYLNPDNKNAAIVGFRSMLDEKLNPKDAEQPTIKLPENLLPIDKLEALRDSPIAKGMQLSQCRIENGWFYLGWNYVPAGSNSFRPVDLPAIWNQAIVEQMDSSYTPTNK